MKEETIRNAIAIYLFAQAISKLIGVNEPPENQHDYAAIAKECVCLKH